MQEKVDKSKSSIPMLWISIASMAMIFAGLTSAYIVSSSSRFWVDFALPQMFTYSTILIVLSSITFFRATSSAKKNNQSGVKAGTAITLLLGIAFVITQFMGWGELVDKGFHMAGTISNIVDGENNQYLKDYTIYYGDESLTKVDTNFYKPSDSDLKTPINKELRITANVSSSYMYVIPFMHLAHMAGAIIALIVTFFAALRGKYNADNRLGLRLTAIFWHFLGFLWIFLFLFFQFIR